MNGNSGLPFGGHGYGIESTIAVRSTTQNQAKRPFFGGFFAVLLDF